MKERNVGMQRDRTKKKGIEENILQRLQDIWKLDGQFFINEITEHDI